MPNCVSASVALPVRSCVMLSNFSNSVACSSGRLESYRWRLKSPPKRSVCVPRIHVTLSAKLKVCCLRWLNESFGPPKENCERFVPGRPMKWPRRRVPGLSSKSERRVRDADRLVGQLLREERFVERARVVQGEVAEARLVDQRRAEDVLVGDRERAVAVGAPEHERRDQTRRVGERVERGEVAEEERAGQGVAVG